MIISDLTYLEVTSEAGSVVGGTGKGHAYGKDKDKDKNKYYKKVQIGVANTGNIAIIKVSGKDNEVYLSQYAYKTGDAKVYQYA